MAKPRAASEWVQGDVLIDDDIELISLDELPDDTPEFIEQAREPVPIRRVKLKYPFHETLWRWFLRIVFIALVVMIIAYAFFPVWLAEELPGVKEVMDKVYNWLRNIFIHEKEIPPQEPPSQEPRSNLWLYLDPGRIVEYA